MKEDLESSGDLLQTQPVKGSTKLAAENIFPISQLGIG